MVDHLSVLDAERQLFSAELALSSARLDRATSYLDIYRALGGGWSDAALRGQADARSP